jgi:hypothetical protein
MKNWFTDSYKNLFFDFHTHSSARGVAAGFDADRWADGIAEMGVQAVSAFAVDAFGWRFYRRGTTGWVHPGLPEDLDLLGEITRACHERDMKVIAYFNTMNSEPVAMYRPEFRELDVHGNPKSDYEIFNGLAICWLSDAFDEIFLPQTAEIVENYDVDALFFDGTYAHSACYCPSCRRRFLRETGRQLPTGPEDESWSLYAQWAERGFESVRDRLVDTIVTGRPETLVCVNWYAANRRPAEIKRPENMFLSLDLHQPTQLFDASYQARSWSALDVPFTCMNTAFLDWWGDWGVKPVTALSQECASTIANGGRIFTGYQMYPDLSLHPGVRVALGEMLEFVDERLPGCVGTTPAAEIAVLHPTTTYAAKEPVVFDSALRADRLPVGSYQLGLPDVFADERPVRGAHRMLLELGHDYQFVTEHVLLENLDRYAVVILPAERYVTEELIERLSAFVTNGGKVIATFEPGRLDEKLAEAWTRFLGVRSVGRYGYNHAYVAENDEDGGLADPYLVRSAFRMAVPLEETRTLAQHQGIYLRADGRPLLKTSPPGSFTGRSAVTVRRLGEGTIVNFAFEPFSAYLRTNQWRLKSLVERVLDDVHATPAVRVRGAGTVEVVLRERAGDVLVHLVNHNGYRSVEEGTWATNDSVVPVHDVTVAVRLAGAPAEVFDGLTGEALKSTWQDGVLTVTVPKLDIHTWVELRGLDGR